MTDTQDILFICEEEAGLRLDVYLSQHYPAFSRTYFQDLIEQGLVLVNGQIEKKRYKTHPHDEVDVQFAAPKASTLEPEAMSFDILYEDEHLLAINKPAGLVVHPGAGHPTGTFVQGLIHHCQALQEQESLRPGIVHRLDKETSGVLLAAKSLPVQQKLVEMFANRQVEKVYLAVCVGYPPEMMIRNHIGRHPVRRQQMAVVSQGGKEAITSIKVLAKHDKCSSVALFPKTGRTHQLRVHLQALNCPILGDSVYGSSAANLRHQAHRQLLHAASLHFIHPITSKPLTITAPVPKDMHAYFDPESSQSLCHRR